MGVAFGNAEAAAIVPFSSVQRLMFAVKSDAPGAARASEDPMERRAIAAVKDGDSRPYDYLVSKYMKRVVSIAWGIVRNAHDGRIWRRRHS